MAEGSSWLRIDIRSSSMELIAKYHVETDLPIQKAAEAIAAEQSTGTWTAVRGAGQSPRGPGDIWPRELRSRSAFPRSFLSRETSPSTSLWWRETSSAWAL